ncbi:MAG: aminopeptidase P family protein [Bacilli bacterium]|jgi:Xaa-Pro aminopeptidase|nr:aminopeptidase P family protein [Bacilli bacterium]MDD2682488.1 aminopeptidase P family protein [Bacilli bacterium]MDD3121426.1 aminopeptidase P family protein [Bacilli bacterium]MDD4063285.1 aminopeptidase P family protein [Bacilli bacterium]MDD4482167.1 aminopeptidase P family protein [Bacilli bacterium]
MDNKFYSKNRVNYFEKIKDNSLTVLFSGVEKQKTADQEYDFSVDRNFYYLSGIDQSKAILVLLKAKGENKEYLFVEETSELMAKWVGKKLSKDEAKEISGVENIRYLSDFDSFLFSILNSTRYSASNVENIYLNLERKNDKYHVSPALVFKNEIVNNYPELLINNAYPIIIGLRMIKTDEEIALIKEAIKITNGGILQLMKNSKPGLYEYQLESYFNQYIMFNGQNDHAFKTICASGKNSTILHYVNNNNILHDGDLVLFDLGSSYKYYISDISRTFPVNGKFSSRQKDVYESVLTIQKNCINFLKPGVSWEEYNKYANDQTIEQLKKLGLIKEDQEFRKYYYHSIGHFIGLDTHDPGLHDVIFKEGMVMTVEPGIYIEEENIGVRIEDNILITKEGNINLSKDIIKEVKDIEKIMKTA